MNILPQTKTSGIYKIENTANGKCYVGSAVNIGKRWNKHLSDLNRNKHDNSHLQRAWNKYGEDIFAFSVLELCFPFMRTFREQYFIDTLSPEYNICKTAGCTLGYRHSPETRANMSAAQVGRKMSPETRAKISAAKMGNKHTHGYKQSPEHRAKKSKPVCQFTLNMEFVAEYKSIKAAKEATGATSISQCCSGKRNSTGGFVWKTKVSNE